jgi:hypothetical protein
LPDYWLDSNVFIEGMKGPYGFDIAPRFWELIDEMIEGGRISCPTRVLRELLDGQDDLSAWARERRNSGLFIEADPAVQEASAQVIQLVATHYPDNQARRRFLDRADPWVIAHARVDGGTVVTSENRVPDNSFQVKIPNVCDQLQVQVRSINVYQMLRELGVAWT